MLGTQLNRFAVDEDPDALLSSECHCLPPQLLPAKILRTDVRPIPSRRAISDGFICCDARRRTSAA